MTKVMNGKGSGRDGVQEKMQAVAEQLRQQVAAIEAAAQVLSVVASAGGVGGTDAQWASGVARALSLAALGVDGTAVMPNAETITRRGRPSRSVISPPGRYDPSGLFLDETPMAVVEIGTTSYRGNPAAVAVGIDPNGHKRVLGYRAGSTYDRITATAMCQELYARGLRPSEGTQLLAVTDGAEAIDQAFLERFPRAAVAHCQRAVEENVLAHLAPDMREDARRELRSAWNLEDLAQAENDLAIVCDQWASLFTQGREGVWAQLDRTLTVNRLGLGPALGRTLSTLCVLRTAVTECRRLGARNAGPGEDPFLLGVEGWLSATRRVIGHEGLAGLAKALGSSLRPSLA